MDGIGLLKVFRNSKSNPVQPYRHQGLTEACADVLLCVYVSFIYLFIHSFIYLFNYSIIYVFGKFAFFSVNVLFGMCTFILCYYNKIYSLFLVDL